MNTHMHTYLHAYTQCIHTLSWVDQAGLLTPLTFAWHHLSPLAAFPSGVFFLQNGGDSKFANFTPHFWRPAVRMCLVTSNNVLLVL